MSARCNAQDQRLYSADGTVFLVPQGDGNLVLCAPATGTSETAQNMPWQRLVVTMACTSCRYNATLVASSGESASSAIFATETYSAAANGHPPPYTLTMQTVLSPQPGWSHSSQATQGPRNLDTCALGAGLQPCPVRWQCSQQGRQRADSRILHLHIWRGHHPLLAARLQRRRRLLCGCRRHRSCALSAAPAAAAAAAVHMHKLAAAYNHDATLEHACTVHYRAAAHDPDARCASPLCFRVFMKLGFSHL